MKMMIDAVSREQVYRPIPRDITAVNQKKNRRSKVFDFLRFSHFEIDMYIFDGVIFGVTKSDILKI